VALFSIKKKEAPPAVAAQAPAVETDLSQPPISTVMQMRQQGFTNNQIVQANSTLPYPS